jgi:hypothetical protein
MLQPSSCYRERFRDDGDSGPFSGQKGPKRADSSTVSGDQTTQECVTWRIGCGSAIS